MRELLETSGDELVAATAARLEALRHSRKVVKRREGELAEARAGQLALSPERIVDAHFDGVDGGFLQSLARALLTRTPTKLALLTAAGEAGSLFCLVAGTESGADLSELGPRVAATLGGRGGGSATIYQGKTSSLEHRPEALALLEMR